jgi:hypothetical protein
MKPLLRRAVEKLADTRPLALREPKVVKTYLMEVATLRAKKTGERLTDDTMRFINILMEEFCTVKVQNG